MMAHTHTHKYMYIYIYNVHLYTQPVHAYTPPHSGSYVYNVRALVLIRIFLGPSSSWPCYKFLSVFFTTFLQFFKLQFFSLVSPVLFPCEVSCVGIRTSAAHTRWSLIFLYFLYNAKLLNINAGGTKES